MSAAKKSIIITISIIAALMVLLLSLVIPVQTERHPGNCGTGMNQHHNQHSQHRLQQRRRQS